MRVVSFNGTTIFFYDNLPELRDQRRNGMSSLSQRETTLAIAQEK